MTICDIHPDYYGGEPDTDCPKCNKHYKQESIADKSPNIKKRDPYKRREKHKTDWLDLPEEE